MTGAVERGAIEKYATPFYLFDLDEAKKELYF